MVPNQGLREYAKQHGVPLWKVAHVYGINDGNLSRRLRFEFTAEQATRFKQIVDELAFHDSEKRKGE